MGYDIAPLWAVDKHRFGGCCKLAWVSLPSRCSPHREGRKPALSVEGNLGQTLAGNCPARGLSTINVIMEEVMIQTPKVVEQTTE